MTTYINIVKMQYPRHQGDIQLDPEDQFESVQWVDPPLFDPKTQRCAEGFPERIDGMWYMTWIVRDATSEELEEAKKPPLGNNIIPP